MPSLKHALIINYHKCSNYISPMHDEAATTNAASVYFLTSDVFPQNEQAHYIFRSLITDPRLTTIILRYLLQTSLK